MGFRAWCLEFASPCSRSGTVTKQCLRAIAGLHRVKMGSCSAIRYPLFAIFVISTRGFANAPLPENRNQPTLGTVRHACKHAFQYAFAPTKPILAQLLRHARHACTAKYPFGLATPRIFPPHDSAGRVWSLRFGICLRFGIWCLGFASLDPLWHACKHAFQHAFSAVKPIVAQLHSPCPARLHASISPRRAKGIWLASLQVPLPRAC